jgi:hypothetical protein
VVSQIQGHPSPCTSYTQTTSKCKWDQCSTSTAIKGQRRRERSNRDKDSWSSRS